MQTLNIQLHLARPAAQACATPLFCMALSVEMTPFSSSIPSRPPLSSNQADKNSDSSVLGKYCCGSDCRSHAPLHTLSSKQKVLSIVPPASFNLPAQTARQLSGVTWQASRQWRQVTRRQAGCGQWQKPLLYLPGRSHKSRRMRAPLYWMPRPAKVRAHTSTASSNGKYGSISRSISPVAIL